MHKSLTCELSRDSLFPIKGDAMKEKVFLVCYGTEVRKLTSTEKVMLLVFAGV